MFATSEVGRLGALSHTTHNVLTALGVSVETWSISTEVESFRDVNAKRSPVGSGGTSVLPLTTTVPPIQVAKARVAVGVGVLVLDESVLVLSLALPIGVFWNLGAYISQHWFSKPRLSHWSEL